MKSNPRGNKDRKGLNSDEIYNHPTATVIQSRVPIFAPVTRHAPNSCNQFDTEAAIETRWGCCMVKDNRLTQIHRDLIEAIFTHHTNIYRHDTGDVTYIFNPYLILRKIGHKRPDIDWLRQKFNQLRQTTLEVHETRGRAVLKVEAGIVVRHAYISELKCGMKEYQFDKGPFAVQISAEFLKVFENDLRVHYPALTDKILKVESPLARAAIRFFLTHQKLSISPTKLLATLGVKQNWMTGRAWNMKLQELREAAPILAEFGITTAAECLHYSQHSSVWFTRPHLMEEVESAEAPHAK